MKQRSAPIDQRTLDLLEEATNFAQALGAIAGGMERCGSAADKRIVKKIDAAIEADRKEFDR